MNLQFFPSKRIALYMARLFLLRSFAVLGAIVLILQMLDLLGESGHILAYPGNGDPELWRYVSLRIPQLVARFLPFSVLLGTLIALATLNQNSEIVSMKAAGISAHQIIAPLVLASFGVAILSFAFNERIVTRATDTLNAWEAVNYGPVPKDSGMRPNVWVRWTDDLIHVQQVQGTGEATRLAGITVYDRGGATLQRIINAKAGRRQGKSWLLIGVDIFNVNNASRTQQPAMLYGEGLDPRQFELAKVNAEEEDFATLRQSIRALQLTGHDTSELESGFWHKISGPLSSILMPLLAAVAAFGLARSGQLFVRAVIGMGLGFAYFVADNFALAMGNLGAYPPLVAAWAPFLLFLLIGEAVLIRTEE
ncbi:MAG TPA: LPS export ABC transporter permease LptG [Allosphingosinicella sp.]|nr:LPS export ABC transporter permease LptG [Allosphingosinicella sp.]